MLKRLMHECEGQDLVEYAVLIAVVALIAAASLSSFQNVVSNVWTSISNNLSGSGS
jgi:Flp pilus assembly pilin Flp